MLVLLGHDAGADTLREQTIRWFRGGAEVDRETIPHRPRTVERVPEGRIRRVETPIEAPKEPLPDRRNS